MARLSIDDDAVVRLKGYSSEFKTDDLSKIILLLAAERDILVRCIEGHVKTQAIAPTDPLQSAASSGLEELSELLND